MRLPASRDRSPGLVATARACLAVALLAVGGCGRREPPGVEELAEAMRAHGCAYAGGETAALPQVGGVGLRLTGEGLEVELYRIPDGKEFRLAVTAAAMASAGSTAVAAGAEAREAGRRPIGSIAREPFLVIVRREPEPGHVARALDQALDPNSE
jgi:hypothetical protein